MKNRTSTMKHNCHSREKCYSKLLSEIEDCLDQGASQQFNT
jgi:hypothetical protein